MYAIIETCGKQYRVTEGETIVLDRLSAEAGNDITFDKVLLIVTDDGTTVGAPTVAGATVTATVLGDERGPKVISFKYRRRRRSRVRRGFRHSHTTVQITGIKA